MMALLHLTVTFVAVIVAAVFYRRLAEECATARELRKRLASEKGRVWSTLPGVSFSGVIVTPTLEDAKAAERELSATLEAVRKFRIALEAAKARPDAVREEQRIMFRLRSCAPGDAEPVVRTIEWRLPGVGWHVCWTCSADGQGGLISSHGADETAARAAAEAAKNSGLNCPCGNYLTEIVCCYGEF